MTSAGVKVLHKHIYLFIPQGELPVFVNATAGTTVLGSYDPFGALADICHKHGLWLNVDVRLYSSVV